MYEWIVFLHLLGALVFFMAHQRRWPFACAPCSDYPKVAVSLWLMVFKPF